MLLKDTHFTYYYMNVQYIEFCIANNEKIEDEKFQ